MFGRWSEALHPRSRGRFARKDRVADVTVEAYHHDHHDTEPSAGELWDMHHRGEPAAHRQTYVEAIEALRHWRDGKAYFSAAHTAVAKHAKATKAIDPHREHDTRGIHDLAHKLAEEAGLSTRDRSKLREKLREYG